MPTQRNCMNKYRCRQSRESRIMKIHSLPSFQLSCPPVAHEVPLLEAGGRVSLHPTPLPRPPSTHHTHDTTCLHGGTSIRSGELPSIPVNADYCSQLLLSRRQLQVVIWCLDLPMISQPNSSTKSVWAISKISSVYVNSL